MPTYDPLIPTKSASPATSHEDIKDNYQAALDALAINHGAFGAPFEGNHDKIYLKMQTSDQTASAGAIVVYGKAYEHDTPATTTDELWIRRKGSKSPTTFTGYGTTNNVTGSTTSDIAWFYLPTGELVKCGTSTWDDATGSAAVPLNLAVQPSFTDDESLRGTVVMNNTTGGVTIAGLSKSSISFSVNKTGAKTVSWMVIGV